MPARLPYALATRLSAALCCAQLSAALISSAMPGQAAEPSPLAEASPAARRMVFIPFENPSNRDGYIEFANGEFAKKLAANGFALAAKPGLDQVDARLGARDLCAQERAEGILVATHIDHDQQYHKGVAHSFFGAVLGIVPIVGNVVANGVNTVLSDDRSVNRATLGALLVDCSGRKVWGETVQGDNTHHGRNEAAGGSGAIDDGLTKLVASMMGTLRPASAIGTADPAAAIGTFDPHPAATGTLDARAAAKSASAQNAPQEARIP